MKTSRDRVITSHAGSLPRPDALIEANRNRESGMRTEEPRFREQLVSAVIEVVRRQRDIGLDVPGDGEYGKSELVAERIAHFAGAVGKERVNASTDCGLGGRVHPEIAWAKLGSLAAGAALATRQLWH